MKNFDVVVSAAVKRVDCTIFTFPNNPKDLDPSYKTDLDFCYCFGRKKLRLITEEIG